MGNVCSSAQKKKKDSLSEKSDDSPSYQLSVKKETKFCNDNLISILDPEEITYNTTERIESSEKMLTTETISQEIEQPTVYDSTSSTPQTITAPSELPKILSNPSLLNILQGKLPRHRKIERDKKIVIYILSDSSYENIYHKNIIHILHKHLEAICLSKGFELVISDVHGCNDVENKELAKSLDICRWAQSPLEAKGGHEEAENCLAEISRHVSTAYVIPVLFLGSTLGTPMLPLTIESQDFKSVLSLGEENDKRLLEMWYKLDDSYEPSCHRLNTSQTASNSVDLTKELINLINTLLKLFSDDLKDSYMTTCVEQEINNTVLISQELAKRCIWIHNGVQYLKVPDNASVLETEVFRRTTKIYSNLKTNLCEKNLIRVLPSMNILEEELKSVIKSLLDKTLIAIFDEHLNKNSIPNNTNGVSKSLLKEVQLVCRYSSRLAQNSSNSNILEDIKRFIDCKSDYPLIVTGSPGIGKSVLVSKIMENICKWNSEIHLIVRYPNLSDESSDITTLLGSIANQLSVLVNGSECRVEHTINNYAKEIRHILEHSPLFIVILIDSVDEISNTLDWLPMNIKSRSKIILTLTEYEGYEASSRLQELMNYGIPNKNFIKLKHFSKYQWNDILCSGGAEFNASNGALRLPEDWKNFNDTTPFNAKALWWLAWLGHSSIINTNISKILENMFNILELKFCPVDLQLLLLIISVSKRGIRESDCLSIFRNETKVEVQSAYKIWSKFCWIMGPMLLYLNNIRIADKIFREAVISRYASKERYVHNIIVDYFEKQPNVYASIDGITLEYNCQKYLKLPYHYLCALNKTLTPKMSQELCNSYYFTDLQWIFNKIKATGSIPMLYDIKSAERILGNCDASFLHIQVLRQFLEKHIYQLNYDGNQFPTWFKLFLKKKRRDEKIKNNQVIIIWYSSIDQIKSTYLEIINSNVQDQDNNLFGGYDELVYLPENGYFVASLSTEREEICIWDVQKCERVRELRSIPQPTDICSVGKFEAAILCRREIKVINLDAGKFKVTLKGVMNQKMPYFGLHDEKHLVCLSRNRMYVNLMNLESGDCVTTFKAGEDRFLNSLLVSGDGRILVCGDETQKPFPLLVWHLSQRKLLYDLRIPHHDFLTSLSAITYEGSYVCVVAKELNEPTPNFIVVYDLQSGTLFKKWKPTCNTVSLAISQINACVIAGLDDASILIWDLVTGNCRSTLVGHNAPVTFLKLDPLGKVLLSRDKDGRDFSIRLWEISSGTPLAVYTPPSQISSCEILPNGLFVILALKSCTNILTLVLKNYCELPNETPSSYGNNENQYKVFNLN